LARLAHELGKNALPFDDLTRLPEPLLQSCTVQLRSKKPLSTRVLKLLSELSTTPRLIHTIGVIDMDAHFQTTKLMRYPSAKYPDFMLFELHVAVPAGLVKSSPHFEAWADTQGGIASQTRMPAAPSLIAADFHYFADSIRRQFQLDTVLGVTPGSIAAVDGLGVRAGLLSDTREGSQALSSHGLHSIARLRGQDFSIGARICLEAYFDSLRAKP
jgi:hypothetical protein